MARVGSATRRKVRAMVEAVSLVPGEIRIPQQPRKVLGHRCLPSKVFICIHLIYCPNWATDDHFSLGENWVSAQPNGEIDLGVWKRRK